MALNASDMKRQNTEEFAMLQEGEVISVTYFRISEAGPPPVLFAVGWGIAVEEFF